MVDVSATPKITLRRDKVVCIRDEEGERGRGKRKIRLSMGHFRSVELAEICSEHTIGGNKKPAIEICFVSFVLFVGCLSLCLLLWML